VVVSFDPLLPANAARLNAFRAHYGINASVAIIGPFQGSLADSGARLELYAPDTPPPETPSLIPQVLGDEVLYDNLDQWPTLGGTGQSITRTSGAAFGNDGVNWLATIPSPGAFVVTPVADFNSDGDVDGSDFLTWQRGLGVGSSSATQASGNADGDQDVDASDLAVWRTQFGALQGAGGMAVAQPLVAPAEPATPFDMQSLSGLSWVETYVAEEDAGGAKPATGSKAEVHGQIYEQYPSAPSLPNDFSVLSPRALYTDDAAAADSRFEEQSNAFGADGVNLGAHDAFFDGLI
jgi:hypothetical protein